MSTRSTKTENQKSPGILRLLADWLFPQPEGADIMLICVDLVKREMECFDWTSERIKALSGELTQDNWDRITKWCATGSWPYTRVSIWAGKKMKHLVDMHPVEPFLNTEIIQLRDKNNMLSPTLNRCPTCQHPIAQ